MKTVYFIKDTYQDNTMRITYYEKDVVTTYEVLEIDEETGKLLKVVKEQVSDKHLFCERLKWEQDERELDSYIEEMKIYWEARINS